jgi:hypothetical protein
MLQDPRIKFFVQIFFIVLVVLLLLQYVIQREMSIPQTIFISLIISRLASEWKLG